MSSPSKPLNTLSNDAFGFLSRAEYFEELTKRIAATKAGDRIVLVTHKLDTNNPPMTRLMQALSNAAARGVETHFALDERTLPLLQRLPLNRRSVERIKITKDVLDRFQASGGRYAVTNKTYRRFINQFAGRSHIKLAVINDEVYVGGCNLADVSLIDMMVRWHDPTAAQWLYDLMSDLILKQSTKQAFGTTDRELVIDERTKLLLDCGKPRQSIIYDHALSLIDTAQEWIVMTCQYFPSSRTARHLAAAYKRGVNVSLYFNHPSKHLPGHNILHHIVLAQERTHRPGALFDQQLHKDLPFLHAKLLATEAGAMIGSHNYVAAGVTFGTAELTLLRYDRKFSELAVRHFHDQLASLKI